MIGTVHFFIQKVVGINGIHHSRWKKWTLIFIINKRIVLVKTKKHKEEVPSPWPFTLHFVRVKTHFLFDVTIPYGMVCDNLNKICVFKNGKMENKVRHFLNKITIYSSYANITKKCLIFAVLMTSFSYLWNEKSI